MVQQEDLVVKKCKTVDACSTLEAEYFSLITIHHALQERSAFQAPQPVFFTGAEANWEDLPPFPPNDVKRTSVYSMARVLPLPRLLRHQIINTFAPATADKSVFLSKLFIARLLLGRADDAARSAPRQFFSVYNFPLTAADCRTLKLPVADIAREMGRAYAALHMHAGVDARDVKFVLGGRGRRSNGVGNKLGTQMDRLALAVIDFNQVQRWSKHADGITAVVSAFLGK